MTARSDRAVYGILGSNALTLGIALWQDWPLVLLLWPYWLQSVIIGWYARRRILALTRFSTEGFRMGGREVEPNDETRRSTANFFAFHYGFFHFGYLIFIVAISAAGLFGRTPDAGDFGLIALLGSAFWWTHRDSHRRHVAADVAGTPNIGTLMFLPYLRVFPMHVTIILGGLLGGGPWALLLFTVLKTVADVLMHLAEHRWLQKEAAAGAAT
jgi:hypothetical protein